jgi:hypothetical protein
VDGKEWFELLSPTLINLATVMIFSKYGMVPDVEDRLGDLLVGMADAAYPKDPSYIPAYPSSIKQLLDAGLIKPEQLRVQRERVVYNPYFAGGLCDRVGYFLRHIVTQGMIEVRQQAAMTTAEEVVFTDLVSAAEEDEDDGLEDRLSLLDELFQQAQLVDRTDAEGSLWQTVDGDTLTLPEYVAWASERYRLETGQTLSAERQQAMTLWLLSQSSSALALQPVEPPSGSPVHNVRASRVYYGYLTDAGPSWEAYGVMPEDQMRARVQAADKPYFWTDEDMLDPPFNTEDERQLAQDTIPVSIIEPHRLMQLLSQGVMLWEGIHPDMSTVPEAHELHQLLLRAYERLQLYADVDDAWPEIEWLNAVLDKCESIDPFFMDDTTREGTRVQLAEFFGIEIDGSGYIERTMTSQATRALRNELDTWFDKLIVAGQMKEDQKEFLDSLMNNVDLNRLLKKGGAEWDSPW